MDYDDDDVPYCNHCQCAGHGDIGCRAREETERIVNVAHQHFIKMKRFKDQYKLEVTKRKTKCHSCDESIMKNSLRVHHFGELTEFKGRVFRPGCYFHLSCWNGCSGMKPSKNNSKAYEDFFSFPENIRTIILNSNEDTDKFIPVIQEKITKAKSADVSNSSGFVAVITNRKSPPSSGDAKRQRKTTTNHQQPSSPPKAKRSKCSAPKLVSP